MDNVKYSDLDKVCRICMKCSASFHLISEFNILEMIVACASVQISFDDELPNKICYSCYDDLHHSFNFVQTCQSSDTTFRRIIEEYKVATEHSIEMKDFKVEEPEEDYIEADNAYSDADSTSLKEETDDDDKPLSTMTEFKVKNKRKYVCDKCDLAYDKAWLFGFHMKRVHKSQGIKCSKCAKVCYHQLHLEAHMDIVHNETKYICDICQRHFSNRFKLDRHKSSHVTERLFHCLKCNNSFKDNWVLTKHIRTIHENPEKRVSCKICSKTMLPRHLERHLLLHENREKIKCKYCPKLFFYAHTLDIHIQRIHEKTLPSRNFKYLCNLCGRGVASQAELERHNLTHTGEKPYGCDKCDKKYRTKAMLRTHDSRVHLDVRNFKCTLCTKAFFDRIFLDNHMRVHTGERPFSCDTCDKKYKTKSMLATHVTRTHLNKRKFQCTECPKSFHEKRNIVSHMLTHSGEKPFKCDFCDKCYSSKSALNNHSKTHNQ